MIDEPVPDYFGFRRDNDEEFELEVSIVHHVAKSCMRFAVAVVGEFRMDLVEECRVGRSPR